MPRPIPPPEAREVDRIVALMTADGIDEDADAFLARCVDGATWTAHIRTTEVAATVLARFPLGTFDERACTCVDLHLALPVPVEPGLRFRLVADDGSAPAASGIVRPWAG